MHEPADQMHALLHALLASHRVVHSYSMQQHYQDKHRPWRRDAHPRPGGAGEQSWAVRAAGPVGWASARVLGASHRHQRHRFQGLFGTLRLALLGASAKALYKSNRAGYGGRTSPRSVVV